MRTPLGAFDSAEWDPASDGRSVRLTEEVVSSIGKDLSGSDRDWLMRLATPWPLRHPTDPITLTERFDRVKSAYVLCTGGGDSVDEILAGRWGKLEGPYRIIESGHWPMITKPGVLAGDLISLTEG